MGKINIEQLLSLVKNTKKVEKIIKNNSTLNKWYQSGHIRIYINLDYTIPVVEVWRAFWEGYDQENDINMDKRTKDSITSILRKNNFVYLERIESYIYYS